MADWLATLTAQFNKVAANSSLNALMRDVIGSKDDTATFTPGVIRSLMMYLKGMVEHVNGTEFTGESPAANLFAGGIAIISMAADGNRKEINGVWLSMTGSGASVTNGATVTIRVYRMINGVLRKVDEFSVVKDATIPDGVPVTGIPIVTSWTLLESNALGGGSAFIVTMQSNNPADVAVIVPYSYTTRKLQF